MLRFFTALKQQTGKIARGYTKFPYSKEDPFGLTTQTETAFDEVKTTTEAKQPIKSEKANSETRYKARPYHSASMCAPCLEEEHPEDQTRLTM